MNKIDYNFQNVSILFLQTVSWLHVNVSYCRNSIWFAGRETVDKVETPNWLVGRHHVTGVPDQQHGQRPVRRRIAGHVSRVIVAQILRALDAPDRACGVLEALGARPL